MITRRSSFRCRAQSVAARLVVVILAFGSCACASVRPITDQARIGGRPAKHVVVVLNAPFSFQHLLVTYTLPPGRYVATMEDDSGVYFEAPRKILAAEALAAPFFFDGGLYFRTDGRAEIDQYVIVRNQPLFVTLPADFPYSFDQS